jgi:hypothetical protein
MKLKKILLSCCLMLLFAQAFSQGDLNEKISSENVVAATIIKEGKEIAGYIKQMGTTSLNGNNYAAPWEFQGDIRFMEKDAFEKAEKIKNKDYMKYEAGDIDGYKYNGEIYEAVKYADMSAVGAGMVAKKMFLKKVTEGKITLYHHFSSPISMGEMSEMEESYRESANPNVVYRIGQDGKLKLVNSLNVKKEITDCPTVVEKYEKGEYGTDGGEEKSGLAKLADKTILRDGIRMAVIEDYNATCK